MRDHEVYTIGTTEAGCSWSRRRVVAAGSQPGTAAPLNSGRPTFKSGGRISEGQIPKGLELVLGVNADLAELAVGGRVGAANGVRAVAIGTADGGGTVIDILDLVDQGKIE
jgi:hypothetical protein